MPEQDDRLGFLRENEEKAERERIKYRKSAFSGLPFTGAEKYFEEIFPNLQSPWKKKTFKKIGNELNKEIREDMTRKECDWFWNKVAVEIDDISHYNNPKNIRTDKEKDACLVEIGVQIVRIPFFIQLTEKVVERLFGKIEGYAPNVSRLFPEGTAEYKNGVPSFCILKDENGKLSNFTPAAMCPAGFVQMLKDFKRISPEQYKANREYLLNTLEKEYPGQTGVEFMPEDISQLPENFAFYKTSQKK